MRIAHDVGNRERTTLEGSLHSRGDRAVKLASIVLTEIDRNGLRRVDAVLADWRVTGCSRAGTPLEQLGKGP